MKKAFFLTVLSVFTLSLFSIAQTKIERYCQVSIDPKNGLTNKIVATISFGEADSLFYFKDKSIIEKLKKVDELTTSTDVLNYMSNLGWSLVSVIPFGLYTIHERIYFKKEFENSDVFIEK